MSRLFQQGRELGFSSKYSNDKRALVAKGQAGSGCQWPETTQRNTKGRGISAEPAQQSHGEGRRGCSGVQGDLSTLAQQDSCCNWRGRLEDKAQGPGLVQKEAQSRVTKVQPRGEFWSEPAHCTAAIIATGTEFQSKGFKLLTSPHCQPDNNCNDD